MTFTGASSSPPNRVQHDRYERVDVIDAAQFALLVTEGPAALE